MYLLNETSGEAVLGRCKSTNQCEHCRRLAAIENSELLHLDAMDGRPPNLWAVLTTRTATLDTAPFYDGKRLVLRALRRRWPEAEYAVLPEYTTGYGENSGGQRRPHWNLLLKGVPTADLAQAQEVISRVWCHHTDAMPEHQHVGEITDGAGIVRYLAHHFAKTAQEPPDGWKGHRLTMSRGYLSMPAAEARERARESLAFKRALWRAENVLGLTGEAIVDAALNERKAASEAVWRLIDLEAVVLAAGRRERNPRELSEKRTFAPVLPAQSVHDPAHEHPHRPPRHDPRNGGCNCVGAHSALDERGQVRAREPATTADAGALLVLRRGTNRERTGSAGAS